MIGFSILFIFYYLCNEIRSDWLNCTKNLKQYFFLFPGPLIGTSIGGLILGLVFGGGAVYFFRKYKRKGDDMTMNILQDWSNQASKISCFVIIKKDFLTLCRCPSSPDVWLLYLQGVWCETLQKGCAMYFFVCVALRLLMYACIRTLWYYIKWLKNVSFLKLFSKIVKDYVDEN